MQFLSIAALVAIIAPFVAAQVGPGPAPSAATQGARQIAHAPATGARCVNVPSKTPGQPIKGVIVDCPPGVLLPTLGLCKRLNDCGTLPCFELPSFNPMKPFAALPFCCEV
jgi:hypothetical protein